MVPANRRQKSKFEVLVQARDLAKYTLVITKNDNVFKEEYRTALTDDIVRTAKDIYIKSWTANGIYVKDDAEYKWRHKLQIEAELLCNNLLALISLAKKVYHLKDKRIKYWAGKVMSVKNLIKEWKSNDSKRYQAI